jgi:alpha-L-fucosidase
MLSRRSFLKAVGAAAATAPVARVMVANDSPTAFPANGLPRPTPAQMAWQDCEVGILWSFDIPVAARDFSNCFQIRKAFDPAQYNPEKLDTDQWIEVTKAAGARYAIFTATHFNGFMQWQSDAYPYSLKQTRWRGGKGDVVASFVMSCRKAGIKPGIFFSTSHNAYWQVWDHYVDWGKGRGTTKQAAFNQAAERMTEELCSRYGPLVQIWYDAGVKLPPDGGPDVLPLFEKHQPDSVFYNSLERSDHRWIGNEEGYADYPCWATMPYKKGEISHNAKGWQKLLATGDPEGQIWSPGMVDVPIRGANGRHNWFWWPNEDDAVQPTEKLVRMYQQSVGRNCNFIIGGVITSDGLVPEVDASRLAEFGKEIRRRFGNALAETSGEGNVVELKLPRPMRIAHAVIMEEIAHGERIRQYTLEGLLSGDRWGRLGEGQSVGHKRIQSFAPVEVARVRLNVTAAIAKPMFRKLAVYSAGA